MQGPCLLLSRQISDDADMTRIFCSLFHVVVDTDETASRILEVMVKEKSGRVTFMPLNRLRPQNVRYPEQAEEAVPMYVSLIMGR